MAKVEVEVEVEADVDVDVEVEDPTIITEVLSRAHLNGMK